LNLEGKIIGRFAPKVVELLRGKNEPNFLPNLDTGAYVVIVNASKAEFTGNKLNNKYYYNYSGYPSGMRKRSTKTMLNDYPTELAKRIIRGMMTHNKLGENQLGRLFIYPNEQHQQQAKEKHFISI